MDLSLTVSKLNKRVRKLVVVRCVETGQSAPIKEWINAIQKRPGFEDIESHRIYYQIYLAMQRGGTCFGLTWERVEATPVAQK
jgi:hypothetical protein